MKYSPIGLYVCGERTGNATWDNRQPAAKCRRFARTRQSKSHSGGRQFAVPIRLSRYP